MLFKQLIFSMIAAMATTAFCFGQTSTKQKPPPQPVDVQAIRSSPAYAEVLLRRTELDAELESLLVDYNEEYPKVKEIRFELGLVKKESERLLELKAADVPKLTLALGRLIVRKIELQADLENLRQRLKDEHPDVKKAKRKVEIFENAIKEILG